MKALINMIFDYAVLMETIPVNISRTIKSFSNPRHDYVTPTPVKRKEQEVFSDEESKKLAEACCKLFRKNNNTTYLAIVMNFYLGLRAGELVGSQFLASFFMFVKTESDSMWAKGPPSMRLKAFIYGVFGVVSWTELRSKVCNK